MSCTTHKKVIVFGIDGGCTNSLQPWLSNGTMPFLANFMERNFAKDILCEIDMALGWPTFITGKHPRNHLGYYWMGRNRQAKKDRLIVNSNFLGKETLWHILKDNNIKVALINVPFTYPPLKMNGHVISGPGGGLKYDPNRQITHPEGLMNEIRLQGIDYRMKWYDVNSIRHAVSYIQNINMATKSHIDAAKYIVQKYDPDLLMIVFRGHDAIQHRSAALIQSGNVCNYPKLMSELEEYYSLIDYGMHDIYALNNKYDQLTMIASDHGFGPCHLKVNIDHVFKENKWLKFDYSPILFKILKKAGIPSKKADKSFVNFQNTIAYRDSTNSISLNVKGRDPEGVVEPSEYIQIRDKIIHFMSKLSHGKYGKIFERITTPDALGISDEKAMHHNKYFPDIVYSPRPGIHVDGGFRPRNINEFNKQFIELRNTFCNWTGTHRENGLFAVETSATLQNNFEGTNLMDLAPSILSYFGIQVPGWMDGTSFIA